MAIYDLQGTWINSAYNLSGDAASSAYDIDGELVYTIDPTPADYDDYTMTVLHTESPWLSNCQGIAIHNGILFQFRTGPDEVTVFDMSNWSKITSSMSIESDHGDSATFSPEYYSQSDEFPLLYVTADTTPAKIYIDRVTRNSATLIKTLIFPQSAGYYGAGAFDWDNNICYLLAYKKNNYTTDDGGTNTTVVSKWDMSHLIDNGDGTYTPTFISQYERDFILVMQGLAYHDDLIWISSGYTETEASHIYAMNPTTGVIAHTITMDNNEVEGLYFVYDSLLPGSHYMVTAQQGGKYKKYTFGEAE